MSTTERACPHCKGQGQVIDERGKLTSCSRCGGSGAIVRSLTPTERLHDIARAMAERPAPVSAVPVFEVSQTKAVGGATVYEWSVHVPECEEYPDAEQAFAATVSFARRLAGEFPATAANGEPTDKKPADRTARAAAAIARSMAKS